MSISMIGIDYKKASVDVRAQFSFTKKNTVAALEDPSLGFSTIILYEFINSYFLSSQHVCWLFLIFQKLDKNSFLLLINWCYGVIL